MKTFSLTPQPQDDFYIEIYGKGGHGASPHETVDPLVTGSQLVLNLQQIISRKVHPLKSATISVGSFTSGSTTNIIPDTASLKGTVRTYDNEVRELIQEWMTKVTKSTCEATGATYELNYINDCPAIYNEPQEPKLVERVATKVWGEENIIKGEPMMGSEDFAYYTEVMPGVYFMVGGNNPELATAYPHHHPMFDVDERSMLDIAKLFTGMIFSEKILSE